ncbi:MAG: bi-domain-containing oxidoreductase [Bacteroidales bacterium]|nr:bi-domain-containing oxidoreductase [Bacteroidales bacterium]
MKQVIVKKGTVINEEVPVPAVETGYVLIRVAFSCISAGTEISGIRDTNKSILTKAMEKPEKVRQVLNMLSQRGIKSTLRQVKDLDDTGRPSGYSVSGTVVELAPDVKNLKPGDRVAAAGGGYAIHAEYVLVPKNLVVKIPDRVTLQEASAATIGAIALHGARRASLSIGEFGVVVGCGIIGLFTIQILKAAGVKVAAVEINERRLEMAHKLGADLTINPSHEDAAEKVKQWSEGMGADAVLFTAAVKSPEPLAEAFRMCRRKGRVVLVGSVPIEIKREDIYPNEIDFLISTSYGPGRYDKNYEEGGHDYPYPYVRWTEQRNIGEFLSLVSKKLVDVQAIIDRTFSIEKSAEAFEFLSSDASKPLVVLIEYPQENGVAEKTVPVTKHDSHKIVNKDTLNVAVVGTGSFFKNVHLPNLQSLKDKFKIYAVMSRKGYDAKLIADQNGASYSTTDYQQILSDPEVDLVFICTRHASHGSMTLQALEAGKHVFVEKPLAVNRDEIDAIEEFFKKMENPPLLMVGYNRRYSKFSREIKKAVSGRINPLFIRYRMNAGYLKPDHWIFSEGGRIIGEACHIIDLMQYLVGYPVIEISSSELTPATEYYSPEDNKSFTLKFEDGSLAVIDYFSCGNNNLSKEFMEVHFENKSIVMDDYKKLKPYGLKMKQYNQTVSDKGHLDELIELYNHLTGQSKGFPVDLDSLFQNVFITFSI